MDALPVSTPGSEDGGPVTKVVSFNKPLHRFIRAEPKSIGVAMLFLGGSQLLTGIPMLHDITGYSGYTWFWLGTMFFICGVLFFVSGTSPSKKQVTASLALSIISILATGLAVIIYLIVLNELKYDIYYPDYDISNDNMTDIDDFWRKFHKDQLCCMEGIWLVHSIAGAVILIVMSAFSRAALKSNKTQATAITYNQPSGIQMNTRIKSGEHPSAAEE